MHVRYFLDSGVSRFIIFIFLVFLCCLEFVKSLEKESKYFDLKSEIETNATLSCDDVLANEEVKCQSVAASREENDRSSFVSTQAADAFSKASYVRKSSGEKHQCVAQNINSTVNATTCVSTPCKKAHLMWRLVSFFEIDSWILISIGTALLLAALASLVFLRKKRRAKKQREDYEAEKTRKDETVRVTATASFDLSLFWMLILGVEMFAVTVVISGILVILFKRLQLWHNERTPVRPRASTPPPLVSDGSTPADIPATTTATGEQTKSTATV